MTSSVNADKHFFGQMMSPCKSPSQPFSWDVTFREIAKNGCEGEKCGLRVVLLSLSNNNNNNNYYTLNSLTLF